MPRGEDGENLFEGGVQTRHVRPSAHHAVLKHTFVVIAQARGTPLSRPGEYRHSLIVRTASASSSGSMAFITSTPWTRPSVATVTRHTTQPVMPRDRA